MPIPSTTQAAEYQQINLSASVCDQLTSVLETNDRLRAFFAWAFDPTTGLPTPAFLADLRKWTYGPLISTGTSGAYAIISTPPFAPVEAAPSIGRVVYFIANMASPLGGSTLALDSGTAYPLLTQVGAVPVLGEIRLGQLIHAVFTGTSWLMLGGIPRISVADINAGPDGTTMRSRDDGTGTVVAVWENDTYVTPDDALVSFPAYGVGAIASAAHGLMIAGVSVAPIAFGVRLVCATAELGWALNDEIPAPQCFDATGDSRQQWTMFCNASVVGVVRMINDTTGFYMLNKSTGLHQLATPGSWKIKFWAKL